MALRLSVQSSLSAFANWLVDNPVEGDRPYSGHSVRYQVARYCDYLDTNPWAGADPLGDEAARDGAVSAYRQYLDTFDAPATVIGSVLLSLDIFYGFLGLGPTRLEPFAAPERHDQAI